MATTEIDFTRIRVGTDSSGRPMYFTRYAWAVWQAVLAHPDIKPFADKVTIVQACFMSLVEGGGAKDSSGFHDLGGCWDIRTWNLTKAELDTLIKVCRLEAGIAIWRRDKSRAHGGMDEHAHCTAGWDYPLSPGAKSSWKQYLDGDNGLASHGDDYEVRGKPLVVEPKDSLMHPEPSRGPHVDAAIAELRQANQRPEVKAALASLMSIKPKP